MLHAGGKFDGKAYAVSGGLHGVGVSVVNALSTRMEVEIHKDGFVWRQPYQQLQAGPAGEGRAHQPQTGSTVTFWPDPTIFETTEFYVRDDLPPAAGDGLPQPRPDHHAARRAGHRGASEAKPREVTFCYKGGIADFVRHLNQTKTPIHKSVIEFGAEGEGMAVEIAMQWNESLRRVGLHLRQHDQHARGRHPRGGLPGRADHGGQPVRRGEEAAQGRREAHRRGHPGGAGRDHLGEAGEPAVRGPDQDQARQHRR